MTYIHCTWNTKNKLHGAETRSQKKLAFLEEVRELIRKRTRHCLKHAKLQVQGHDALPRATTVKQGTSNCLRWGGYIDKTVQLSFKHGTCWLTGVVVLRFKCGVAELFPGQPIRWSIEQFCLEVKCFKLFYALDTVFIFIIISSWVNFQFCTNSHRKL